MSTETVYLAAINAAQNELAGLEQWFLRRKALLEAGIAANRALLSHQPAQSNFTIPPVTSPTASVLPTENVQSDKGKAIWEKVVDWRGEDTGWFTVKDALNGLEATGVPIESPNGFQIMRKALISKPTVFRRDEETGAFRLLSLDARVSYNAESPRLAGLGEEEVSM